MLMNYPGMERVLNITSRIESLREVEKIVDEISTACSMSSEVYGNVLIASTLPNHLYRFTNLCNRFFGMAGQ